MDGVTGTVVVSIVVVSIVVCAAAGLRYGLRASAGGRGPEPRLPESEPAMPGATVAAVVPTAAGAFMAVDAPAEPIVPSVSSTDQEAAARRRSGNSGARRFGPAGANVRTIRSIQTR